MMKPTARRSHTVIATPRKTYFDVFLANLLDRLHIGKRHLASLDVAPLGNLYGEAIVGDVAKTAPESLLIEQAHFHLGSGRNLDDLLFEGRLRFGSRLSTGNRAGSSQSRFQRCAAEKN